VKDAASERLFVAHLSAATQAMPVGVAFFFYHSFITR